MPSSPFSLDTMVRVNKKACNKYACTHCKETFKKSFDQRKHFEKSCKSLGAGSRAFRCNACADTCLTEYQAQKHQTKCHQNRISKTGYKESPLPGKERFTCCKHDHIFRSAREFLVHTMTKKCNLTNADHTFRLRTLLGEGRASDGHRHEYLFAEVMKYCTARGIPEADWEAHLPSEKGDGACEMANKLEWGLTDSQHMLDGGLGFSSVSGMVAEIFAYNGLRSTQTPVPSSKNVVFTGVSVSSLEAQGQLSQLSEHHRILTSANGSNHESMLNNFPTADFSGALDWPYDVLDPMSREYPLEFHCSGRLSPTPQRQSRGTKRPLSFNSQQHADGTRCGAAMPRHEPPPLPTKPNWPYYPRGSDAAVGSRIDEAVVPEPYQSPW